MIFIPLALATLHQTRRPATVSLSESGAPLSRLVPQLATLTGEYLGVSPAINREVLCISVDNAKPDDLLDRIAQATGSKWIEVEGRKTLVANPTARNEIIAAGMRARVARAREYIESFAATVHQSEKPSWQLFNDPVFRELLDGIGPERLAEMKPGERVVFSTRPTPRQEPFAAGALSAVSSYIIRRDDALNASKDKDGATVRANEIEYANGDPINGPIAKANLIVTRDGTFSSLDGFDVTCGELVLYDTYGKELVRQSSDLYGRCGDGRSPFHNDVCGSHESQKPPLAESSTIRQLIATRNPDPNRRTDLKPLNTKKTRGKVQKLLLEPERRDPLSYPGELLVDAAEAKHLQFVASLPDSFMAWLLTSFREARVADDVVEDLKTDLHLVVAGDHGWTVISPALFDQEPFDRRALAELAHQLQGKRYLKLDEECALANLGIGQPDANATVQLWGELTNPILIGLNSSDGWQLLHLLGSMEKDERAEFLREGKLTVSALSPLAYESATEFFYRDSLTHQSGTGFQPSLLPDYRFEPTECLPSGLPDNAVLQMDVATKPTVTRAGIFTDPTESCGIFVESLDMFADANAMNDSPAFRDATNWGPDMQRLMGEFQTVLVGADTEMELHILGSPQTFASGTIHLIRLPDAKVYTPKSLPSDLQTTYDAEYARLAQVLRDKFAGQSSATSGPP